MKPELEQSYAIGCEIGFEPFQIENIAGELVVIGLFFQSLFD